MKSLSLMGALLIAGLPVLGCNGTTNPTPSVGGTGAFGVITIGGKQLLYYPNLNVTPAGNGFLSVIDVGQAGNGITGSNALVTTIDLGTTDQATTTAGNANVVVAAGINTYNVWFINPSNNTVTKTLQLDPSLNGDEFSGGGGIVTGIAMDEANNRAILSVWDGFIFIDLGSMTMTGSVTSAPSENFGFDGTHELVLNPFYSCGDLGITGDGGTDAGFCASYQVLDGGGLITDGLNVINLTTNQVFTYENLAAAAPTTPLGSEPDSAASDPTLQIAVIPSEGTGQQNFLDLSKAVYDSTNLTFTAPQTIVQPSGSYTGVAIESKTHLAFFEEEHESGIAVVDLTQLRINNDAGITATGLVEATMPDTPITDAGGGNGWGNLGDPHGIAVTTGLQSNGPVGFVITDDGAGDVWGGRLDLQKMLSLGASAGQSAGSPGSVLSASQVSPAVTMFNGAVKE